MRKQNVNEDVYFEIPELSVGRRVLRIVGVLVLVLVVGFTFGIWINAEGSHGGQTVMKKLNVIDPDNEGPVLDEGSYVFTATEEYYTKDSEEIIPILDKLNGVHYFTYIPEGYELDSLRYSLYTDVPETADFETLYFDYDSGEKPLLINFDYCDYYPIDEDAMKEDDLEKYISPVTGQCLYISDKRAIGEDTNFWYSILWEFENGVCYIWVEEPKEVGIKIAESIYQYK